MVDERELQMRQQRMKRFQRPEQNGARRDQKRRKQRIHQYEAPSTAPSSAEIDLDQFIVKGTCMELEKDYFRLTSAPDPSTVRPKPVLERALARLQERWSNKEVEYLYMCSQLKAIRQDLTVQHIKDEFTVQVYEYHGRVALEEVRTLDGVSMQPTVELTLSLCVRTLQGDLNEYNQCQTQLKELYRMGLSGCQLEFTAYRILYYLYMLGNKKYSSGSAGESWREKGSVAKSSCIDFFFIVATRAHAADCGVAGVGHGRPWRGARATGEESFVRKQLSSVFRVVRIYAEPRHLHFGHVRRPHPNRRTAQNFASVPTDHCSGIHSARTGV